MMQGIKKAIAGTGLLIGGTLLASLIPQGLSTTSFWFMVSVHDLKYALEQVGFLASVVLALAAALIVVGICLIISSLITKN